MAFHLGDLPESEVDRLAGTIADCAECETFVSRLEDESQDAFLRELSGAAGDARFEAEDELRDAIQKVSAIPSTPADVSSETIAHSVSEHETSASGTEVHFAAARLAQEPFDDNFDGRIGDYVVTDVLGRGGMGIVYRGHHQTMKRDCAIKVLPKGALANEGAAERFHREVEAAAKLMHPKIVTAFDAGIHGGTNYLVMELVDGDDLDSILKEHGTFSVAESINYVIQAAEGLQYAHELGVVHRDVKPSNLLLDKKGTVKILDLGLASLVNDNDSQEQLTQSGQVMGTVDYMAPEQATDTSSATARSDIYSLGCTLYRLLTAQPVYEGETIVNKVMAHAQAPLPSLLEKRLDAPLELEQVFHKMIAKDPLDRFATMQELTAALADVRILVERDDRAESATVVPEPRHSVSKRKLWGIGLTLTAAALLLAAIMTFRFGDVLVTIETPEGVSLPKDISVVLAADGKEVKISSTDQWQARVAPGNYDVNIFGGSDQFSVANDSLTVSRGGKNVLVIRSTAVNSPATTASTRDLPKGKRTDAELLEVLANVDWSPGTFESDLGGHVAAPATIQGIPSNWQLFARGKARLSRTGKYRTAGTNPTRIVSTATGKVVSTIETPRDIFILPYIGWSSDDEYLAYPFNDQLVIHSSDGLTTRKISVPVPMARPSQPNWSPDDTKIAVGYGEKIFIVSRSGEILQTFDRFKNAKGAIWSPDGTYLVVLSPGAYPVIEVATGSIACTAMPKGRFPDCRIRWSPDGLKIWAQSRDGGLAVTAIPSGEQEYFDGTRSLPAAFSPDGKLNVSESGEIRNKVGKVISKLDVSLVPGVVNSHLYFRRYQWDTPERIKISSRVVPGMSAEYSPTGTRVNQA